MAAGPAQLPALCKRRLAEFLRQVDDTDLVWLEEIREEAARMFSRYRSPPRPRGGPYRALAVQLRAEPPPLPLPSQPLQR